MNVFVRRFGEYTLSTDRDGLDIDTVHRFLAGSYWASGIPRAVVERSIANSLCFGIFHDGKQVAFARVVTDSATFAYLCDVFVDEGHRQRGLGKWIMRSISKHPGLQGLRRWALATRDAHGLYRQFGFTPLAAPEVYMERIDPDVYRHPLPGRE